MDLTNSVENLNLSKVEVDQDIISSLPSHVIDKILKCLPLATVAKMSLVSRLWRHYWLTHRYLVFDKEFWEGLGDDDGWLYEWQRRNNIVNTILFNHIGPIYKFHLYMPECNLGQELNFSPWISFLSRIGVRKIILLNWSKFASMPSHIFECKDLLKLRIEYCSVPRAPIDCNGFAYLRSLELEDVEFKHDMCSSLIASCPRLVVLRLVECTGLKNLVICAPSLEDLAITGVFESLAFKNVPRLSYVSVVLEKMKKTLKAETVDTVKMLASSCELKDLNFGGQMNKLLATGYPMNSRTLVFKHLCRLCLTDINLDNFDEFCFTFDMVQRCPFLELLDIWVIPQTSVVNHKIKYNIDYKLTRLLKVVVAGLIGSNAELELIKYLLAVSVVLEEMALKCCDLDPVSELKLSRELLGLPRASPKAKLVCLEL